MRTNGRRNLVRFTTAVARRNQNLLKALALINEQGNACPADIVDHLGFASPSSGRKIVSELLEFDLIGVAYRTTTVGRNGVTYYHVEPNAMERAPTLFPLMAVEKMERANRLPASVHLLQDGQRNDARLSKIVPFRDPLVSALFGAA